MSRYGRSAEEVRLEVAYAIGQGRDVVEHFRAITRARGWSPCR